MKLSPTRQRSAGIIWWLLPLIAIGGWFYPYLGLAVLACMIGPIVVGAVRGRQWCGWVCPRGSFFDYIMSHVSRHRPAPAWLRGKTFRVAVLVFLMGMMAVQFVMAWPDPVAIARIFVLLLGVTTVVGIALAVAYSPRTWCTFCPMGTMASWVSHGKRPLVVSDTCRNCGACAKACPMHLTPQTPGKEHADCIKCGQCVTRCPVSALTFERMDSLSPLVSLRSNETK